jgi:hypothetical protein
MELLNDINNLSNKKQILIDIITMNTSMKDKKKKLANSKSIVLKKCDDIIKLQITNKVTCENIGDYFYSYWTGSEYVHITYPLTFYSEYGYKYISSLNALIDINSNLSKIHNQIRLTSFNLEAYFYTIMMQYIIMKSAEYNDVSYEVYRGLDDYIGREDDKNNEYNKKYIESLSSGQLQEINDLSYNGNLIRLCQIAEQLFKINIFDEHTSENTYVEAFDKIGKINTLKEISMKLSNNPTSIKNDYNVDIASARVQFDLAQAGSILKSDEYTKLGWKIWDLLRLYIKIKKNLKGVNTLFKSYKDKLKENKYIYHQPFSSFTLDKGVAQKFVGKKCCFVTTKLKPQLPYLWMSGNTYLEILGQGEAEILLPLFSEFEIINNDPENIQLDYLGSRFTISDNVFIDCVEKYFKYRAIGLTFNAEEDFYKMYPEYKKKVDDFIKNIRDYYDKIKNGETIVY